MKKFLFSSLLFRLVGGFLWIVAAGSDFWIELDPDCLLHWTCSLSPTETIKIRQDMEKEDRTDAMVFVQDVVLWATSFIGTVVTLALVISGLMYVFSAADSSKKARAKEGVKYSLIWLVLVVTALVVIRLVQFLAWGGSR